MQVAAHLRLLLRPSLRRRTVGCLLIWFFLSFGFYGFSVWGACAANRERCGSPGGGGMLTHVRVLWVLTLGISEPGYSHGYSEYSRPLRSAAASR